MQGSGRYDGDLGEDQEAEEGDLERMMLKHVCGFIITCVIAIVGYVCIFHGKDILCKLGLCYDWVEWKDSDQYPRMKRVCVDCGRIQELVYDFLSHSWSDA